MITIVDYGMGNLGSILNMLRYIGVQAKIGHTVDDINQAEKLVLPGVGAFDTAMMKLASGKLRDALDHKVLVQRTPILGICLGMQLLTRASEEGKLPGLGWIPADTRRFPDSRDYKVPHMGWNTVRPVTQSKLTEGVTLETRFYFVHSYFVQVDDPQHSMLKTSHGLEFDSAIMKENIYGFQFHPEKSHKFGMQILSRFAEV